MTEIKATARDFKVSHASDWCPGCGDFGILNALHQALGKLGLPRHQVAIVGGIGCSGKTPYYVGAYGIHTLHGRLLPFATGVKLANPELTVVATGGDGDGMAIGAGHFVNAGRRNVDLTYILFNNEVYGLTKGQASPTLPLGLQTKSLPEPNIQGRVNPLMLALASGFTWIGRGYAFNVRQLVDLIQRAIQHPGLAYLDVLQPCPTYNNVHSREWYAGKDRGNRPRVYSVEDGATIPSCPCGPATTRSFRRCGSSSRRPTSSATGSEPACCWRIARCRPLSSAWRSGPPSMPRCPLPSEPSPTPRAAPWPTWGRSSAR